MVSESLFEICDQVCITFADGVTEDQVIESQLTRYARKAIAYFTHGCVCERPFIFED